MLYWLIALIVSNVVLGGSIYFITKVHYKEKDEIFNRFMALDFHQYQYFREQFKGEVEHQKKVLKKKREEKITPEEKEKRDKAGGF